MGYQQPPDDATRSALDDTLFAILFTILGCFFNALSLILMKFSIEKVARDARNTNNKKKSSVCNRYWLSGFTSIILGTLFNILAIKYGNLMLLAASSALTLIFNTILSVRILGESYQKSDILAILLICTGSISCMLFSKNDTKRYSNDYVNEMFLSLESLTYLGVSFAVLILVYIINYIIR